MTETVNYYNPNDGIHGRTGGPYLDQQQQVEQERLNAFREDRDPNYETLPLYPGIQAVTARVLVEGYNNTALDGDSLSDQVEINAPVLATSQKPEEDAEEKSAKEKRDQKAKEKADAERTKEANEKSAKGAKVTDKVTGTASPDAKSAEKPVNSDPDEIVVE